MRKADLPLRHAHILGNEHGGLNEGTLGTIAAIVAATIVSIAFPEFAPAIGLTALEFIGLAAAVGGATGGVIDFLTAADNVNRQQQVANITVQTSAYGSPIPQIFGSYRVAGNIIWMGPKVAVEDRSEQSQKGKGKGPANVTIAFTYKVDLAIAICDTQISGRIQRIKSAWADNTLIYSEGVNLPTIPANWYLAPGYADQEPDGFIARHKGPNQTPGYPYLCYLRIVRFNMGAFPRVPNFTFLVEQAPLDMPLADATGRIMRAAGVPEARYDLSAIPNEGVRFVLASVASARAALESLMTVNRFFLFESGDKIVAKSMALEAPVGTIAEAELDAVESTNNPTQGVTILRERSRALPTRITLTYPDPARDYQPNTQVAMFNNLPDIEAPRSVSTSVSLQGVQAKNFVQETLNRLWLERSAFQFQVSRRWAHLEPGDRLDVVSRNATYHVTLQEVNYARPGILTLKGRGDSAQVFFVPGALPGTGPVIAHELPLIEESTVDFLDLPAMYSEDQSPRMHFTYGYPEPTGFAGASLHRSGDGGESYQMVHVGSMRPYAGTASTILPDAPWYVTDTTSTLTVTMEYGEIHSVTAAQFQAGAIHAMLGSELIQFREAELIAEHTYVLRHFWRGRRGTAWATGTHSVGERFTLIDSAVYNLPLPLGERYAPRMWKPVSRGLTILTATEYTYAMQSENLRPWRVASLQQAHDGDDWLLSWRGTARFTGAWIDGSQATPDPDVLSYRVVIFSDGTATTILRQVDVGDSGNYQARQLYTYTEAMQIADFGSAQSVLYAQVYQVGRTDVSRPAAA